MFSAAGRAEHQQFQRSQDSLYSIAKDTGGKALLDYNDLSLGISQASSALTSYYIIGFQSTHTDLDGKMRRVKSPSPTDARPS